MAAGPQLVAAVPHSSFNADSRPAARRTSPPGACRQAPTRHRPSACLRQTATASRLLPQLATESIPDQIPEHPAHRTARPDCCRRDRPRWTRCGVGRPGRSPPSPVCEGQTTTAASRLLPQLLSGTIPHPTAAQVARRNARPGCCRRDRPRCFRVHAGISSQRSRPNVPQIWLARLSETADVALLLRGFRD